MSVAARIVRAMPGSVALPLARGAGAARWALRPNARSQAVEHMARVVDGSPSLRALARRHVIVQRELDELTWRPALAAARGRLSGGERIAALRGEGRGVIVLHTHLCLISPGLYVLSRAGLVDCIVYNTTPDPTPLQLLYERTFAGWGVDMIARGGSFAELERRLRDGQVCHVAGDVPGSAACAFLGRPAGLAAGPARLAMRCAAPVALAVPELRGGPLRARVDVRIAAEVRPGDVGDESALVQRLADLMSAEIERQPDTWQDHEWLAQMWPADPGRESAGDGSRPGDGALS